MDTDNVLYMLTKHSFIPASWDKLAIGLRLSSSVADIEVESSDSHSRLARLIYSWVHHDVDVSWGKLVKAMEMSGYAIAADNLARDVGIRGVQSSGLCLYIMHNTKIDVFIIPGAHNEKERTTLNTVREPTFRLSMSK